jgi:hypothetical protein
VVIPSLECGSPIDRNPRPVPSSLEGFFFQDHKGHNGAFKLDHDNAFSALIPRKTNSTIESDDVTCTADENKSGMLTMMDTNFS